METKNQSPDDFSEVGIAEKLGELLELRRKGRKFECYNSLNQYYFAITRETLYEDFEGTDHIYKLLINLFDIDSPSMSQVNECAAKIVEIRDAIVAKKSIKLQASRKQEVK